MRNQSPVVFVAWTSRSGRASDFSRALGGVSVTVFPEALSGRALTPVRYLASAGLTLINLVKLAPKSAIVTNPPVFAALAVCIYAKVARIPFVLDTHPVGFGAKNNRAAQAMLPLTRWVTRQAKATLVTTDHWKSVVEEWGGRAIVAHEAPPSWSVATLAPIQMKPLVTYVGIFGGDEPVNELVAAAKQCPEMEFAITGDLKRAPNGLVESAPDNVRFTGYLDESAYSNLIEMSDVVCSLTTEPTSVMRAAYEATYALRPLVVSDTLVSRRYFPHAVFADNERDSLATAFKRAVETHAELLERSEPAREQQLERWESQSQLLNEALGLVSSAS